MILIVSTPDGLMQQYLSLFSEFKDFQSGEILIKWIVDYDIV